MNKNTVVVIFILSIILPLTINFTTVQQYPAHLNRPVAQTPKILRDVHLRRQNRYTTPVVSPFKTSSDGRIALSVQDADPHFFLYRPEQQRVHVLQDSPGIKLLASTAGTYYGDRSNFWREIQNITGSTEKGHKTICDGSTAGQGRGNPKSCGSNGTDDCYDLTLVTFQVYGRSREFFRLFGQPIRVRVSNPKTASAQIASITKNGNLVAGPQLSVGINTLFEPTFTADGRLLVARFEKSTLKWYSDDNTPRRIAPDRSSRTEVGYFYGTPEDQNQFAPCDVRQWSRVYPITHAPYHERVRSKYGFARYPFRDPTGRILKDAEPLLITYPWIDKAGKNMMFSTISNDLYRNTGSGVVTEYPTRCVPGTNCQHPTSAAEIPLVETTITRIKTFGIMGLWTHGKMITIDGSINNTEYGIRTTDSSQREIQLYSGDTSWIRVGSGRIAADGQWEQGAANNTTFMESFENLFNFNQHLKPLRIGDVVWTINTGRTSEDFVFDDYINPHTLIASDMNAAFSIPAVKNPSLFSFAYHHENAIRLQNAATSPVEFLKIPPYGAVSGTARIEPVALGGIRGKGLYIFDNTRVDYAIDHQPTDVRNWYTGMFFDFRGTLTGPLFKFPDGSYIMAMANKIEFRTPRGVLQHSVELPKKIKTRQWVHLAVQSLNSSVVEFYIDGTLTSRWNSSHFTINKGTLSIGNFRPNGRLFTGWIDELRVIGDTLNPEYKCNLARGTVLGSALGSSPAPNSLFQTSVSTITGDNSYAYECRVARDAAEIHRNNIPSGYVMIRDRLLAPEGLPVAGVPRPNSTNNAFCLSCHIDQSKDSFRPKSLDIKALKVKTENMEKDRRRQPMQPPKGVQGTVPAHMFGPGKPATPLLHPEGGGSLIDGWLE